MNGIRARAVATVCVLGAVAAFVATGSAHSARTAITASQITAPKDSSYLVYDLDNPNTFAIAGKTTPKAGGNVDLVCYYANKKSLVASSVAVTNGKFSVPAADLRLVNVGAACRLRAIPSGTTPRRLAPFVGPRLLVGRNSTHALKTGPNAGSLDNFYAFFQQLDAAMDFGSLASCGLFDGYLYDASFGLTTITWYCNAALFPSEADVGTRSELQIDGNDAYPANSASGINNQAVGFAPITYTYSVNRKTGDAVIHDTEPLVTCPDHTYPPTALTCATFASTGVVDTRTITESEKGHLAVITDVFSSTDSNSHTLDLLWENDARFFWTGLDATNLGWKFPGQSTYSKHRIGDSINLPPEGRTIYVRMQGHADGDTATGQGAMVYDRSASDATFRRGSTAYGAFTLHQTATIPAGGATQFRVAYAQGYTIAQISSIARLAHAMFFGTTVPNVTHKGLAAAKKAIKAGYCTVGKIQFAFSSRVPRGKVISERPRAKTHVAFGKKINLVVSLG
jgi:hypothetical protein